MAINADKPHLWKADTRASVDQFNQWFMKFAPKAYRETRKKTVESVEKGLLQTKDLTTITPEIIKANPGILPALRMSTCPPRGPLQGALQEHPELAAQVFNALQNITPVQLISEGRVYGGGLHKVEPKELAQIPARAVLESLDSYVRIERQEKLFEYAHP